MEIESQSITVVFRATIVSELENFVARDGWELRRGKTPEVSYAIFDFEDIDKDSLSMCLTDWLLSEKDQLLWLKSKGCLMELDVGVFLGEDTPMKSIRISPKILGMLSENGISLILSSYLCAE